MQNRIVECSKLLGTDGNLLQKGYATGYMLEYDRNDIRAKKARIKEWDYYYVGNDEHAICVTVADMGYVGAISATFMDFKTPSQITKSSIMLFPMGKLHMPSTPYKGDVIAVNGEVEACVWRGTRLRLHPLGRTRRMYVHRHPFQQAEALLLQRENKLYDGERLLFVRRQKILPRRRARNARLGTRSMDLRQHLVLGQSADGASRRS